MQNSKNYFNASFGLKMARACMEDTAPHSWGSGAHYIAEALRNILLALLEYVGVDTNGLSTLSIHELLAMLPEDIPGVRTSTLQTIKDNEVILESWSKTPVLGQPLRVDRERVKYLGCMVNILICEVSWYHIEVHEEDWKSASEAQNNTGDESTAETSGSSDTLDLRDTLGLIKDSPYQKAYNK